MIAFFFLHLDFNFLISSFLVKEIAKLKSLLLLIAHDADASAIDRTVGTEHAAAAHLLE